MATTQSGLSAEKLVKQRHPTAYAEDDGEWVRIRERVTVTEDCPYCHQSWTHQVTAILVSLGGGGDAIAAWEDAARHLDLM